MTTYHEFDQAAIDEALETAHAHYADRKMLMTQQVQGLADSGHMALAAQCIKVTVEDGKVCLNLPLGIGKVCLPIPAKFPAGTVAQACLSICTTWGIPTGVRVSVEIAGITVVSQSFGKC
ncbi:hypothetical protein [Tropicibacter naphthalenivorans]|uniref:Uncharacterized protein n=1 Tax=Tropicibacter naphthalenivorans TaxID=441103 RepID=A0A0P1GTZ1_9RHOB|nr:hypothetical protein [Tropicibacter naphthalenivorans]CUH78612.1 hypothetical protein TRN7648_02073 [Tropicibacter naphthalenivorans]SMC81032.1 hypothetical protein SAMN04488093_104234 [Tropicibacter naphthalenivorans]